MRAFRVSVWFTQIVITYLKRVIERVVAYARKRVSGRQVNAAPESNTAVINLHKRGGRVCGSTAGECAAAGLDVIPCFSAVSVGDFKAVCLVAVHGKEIVNDAGELPLNG